MAGAGANKIAGQGEQARENPAKESKAAAEGEQDREAPAQQEGWAGGQRVHLRELPAGGSPAGAAPAQLHAGVNSGGCVAGRTERVGAHAQISAVQQGWVRWHEIDRELGRPALRIRELPQPLPPTDHPLLVRFAPKGPFAPNRGHPPEMSSKSM